MIGHRRALRSKAEMTVVNRIRRWSSLMKASHARTTGHFEILEWSDIPDPKARKITILPLTNK